MVMLICYTYKLLDELMSQIITLSTQISERSSTLIDNIYTSNIDEKQSSGILLNEIFDHQIMHHQIIFNLIKNLLFLHI